MVIEMSDYTTLESSSQREVSYKKLFMTAVNNWFFIVPIIVICVLISIFYSVFAVTPTYVSTAKLYIVNKETTVINSSDMSISTYLTRDFINIMSDNVNLDEVSKDLGGKYSSGQLSRFIKIDAVDNTRVIEINVSTPDANDSKQIADSICRISEEKLADIMGLDRVKVIRNGNLSKNPSNAPVLYNAFVSLCISILISCTLTFIIYLSDNKINSSSDVQNYLGLNVLATIPCNQNKHKKK